MKIITLYFYKSVIDLSKADQIYADMRGFDRYSDDRANLFSWFLNGLSKDYGNLKEDLLKIGPEILHIIMKRKEFHANLANNGNFLRKKVK